MEERGDHGQLRDAQAALVPQGLRHDAGRRPAAGAPEPPRAETRRARDRAGDRCDHGLVKHLYRGGQKGLSSAIFEAKRHQLTGPVKTPFGYAVFTVVTIHPRHVVPLPTQRKHARRRLAERAIVKATADFTRAFDAKWTLRTTCAQSKECANRG